MAQAQPPHQSWYVSRMGQVYGPIAIEHLRMWAQQGQLAPNDMVAPAGTADWRPASSIPDLAPWLGTAAGRPARPTGVTAIAWIGVAYAAIVLLAIGALAGFMAAARTVPELSEFFRQAGLPTTRLVGILAMGGGMVILMFVSCVGLLRLKEWARKLFLVLTGYVVVVTIVAIVWGLARGGGASLAAQTLSTGALALALTIAGSYHLTRPEVAARFA
jgi:hypothetical protein